MEVSQTHIRYIELAAKMAKNSLFNHKLGTIIIKGGRIIAKGTNNYTTGIHSEVCAIGKQWRSKLRGTTIITARTRLQQPYGLAKPCPKCRKLIEECGIDKIIYTTNNPDQPIAIERVRP